MVKLLGDDERENFDHIRAQILSEGKDERLRTAFARSAIARCVLTKQKEQQHASASASTAAPAVSQAPAPEKKHASVMPRTALADPLQKRLAKKRAAAAAAAAVVASPSETTRDGAVTVNASAGGYWVWRPFAALNGVSWQIFRRDVGIEVQLVQPRGSPTADVSAEDLPCARCWSECAIPYALGKVLTSQFPLPTPIQSQCVPLMLSPATHVPGRDVMGIAETGGGKTMAYLIPMLANIILRHEVLLDGDLDKASAGPLALVIVPARELAEQVTATLNLLIGGAGSAKLAEWEAEESGAAGAASTAANKTPSYNRLSEIRAVKIAGGETAEEQGRRLSLGAHVVVGTVGQLETLLSRRLLALLNTRMVVIDEADRMVETAQTLQQLRAVLAYLPPDPAIAAQRQTVLFTATMSATCYGVARQQLTSARGFALVRTAASCETVTQVFEVFDALDEDATEKAAAAGADDARSGLAGGVKKRTRFEGYTDTATQQHAQQHPSIHPHKLQRLVAWLLYCEGTAIVFANQRKTCDFLEDALRREAANLEGYYNDTTLLAGAIRNPFPAALAAGTKSVASSEAAPLPQVNNLRSVALVHSDMEQKERQRLVQAFSEGKRRVLLTTDLLARGIDVADVQLVVNFDMPWTGEGADAVSTGDTSAALRVTGSYGEGVAKYIHRIGRTGRAGATGMSVSFIVVPGALLARASAVAADINGRGLPKPTEVGQDGNRASTDDDALADFFAGKAGYRIVLDTADAEAVDKEDPASDYRDDDQDDFGDNTSRAVGVKSGRGKTTADRRKDGGDAGGFYSDVSLLPSLWEFLWECLKRNHSFSQSSYHSVSSEKAARLFFNADHYSLIRLPQSLVLLMVELTRSSRFGKISS